MQASPDNHIFPAVYRRKADTIRMSAADVADATLFRQPRAAPQAAEQQSQQGSDQQPELQPEQEPQRIYCKLGVPAHLETGGLPESVRRGRGARDWPAASLLAELATPVNAAAAADATRPIQPLMPRVRCPRPYRSSACRGPLLSFPPWMRQPSGWAPRALSRRSTLIVAMRRLKRRTSRAACAHALPPLVIAALLRACSDSSPARPLSCGQTATRSSLSSPAGSACTSALRAPTPTSIHTRSPPALHAPAASICGRGTAATRGR